MEEQIQEIKRFNRFYIKIMGILSLYADGSSFSATEAMILYETSNKKDCTAKYLSNYFVLDKGYISKILRKFEKRELIERVTSSKDRRVQYIYLTSKGREELKKLQDRANEKVEEMIKDISEQDVGVLIESMNKIEALLETKNRRD
ncbi:MarR family winged helix-turn-helix transcriptional regulator [Oceanobacillus sp. FSL W8-0428]|uniref:MarR family winged helix-turn-helix transcriptional regulator n=1 Tax=Oceanobacillus TaxID=182709 RepID=UPI00098894A2|nr:MarR family winged helix-turn-helix transcriptional regulator [Oceanobacillus sojae]